MLEWNGAWSGYGVCAGNTRNEKYRLPGEAVLRNPVSRTAGQMAKSCKGSVQRDPCTDRRCEICTGKLYAIMPAEKERIYGRPVCICHCGVEWFFRRDGKLRIVRRKEGYKNTSDPPGIRGFTKGKSGIIPLFFDAY